MATTAVSRAQRRLIIEYWFRVLFHNDISIEDISKIAADFADRELFDSVLSCPDFTIKNGTLAFKSGIDFGKWSKHSVFGTVIAEAGAMTYMDNDITFEARMGDGSTATSGVFGKLLAILNRKTFCYEQGHCSWT